MPSSTSNSDRRYLLAAALTFVGLVGLWEIVLRTHAGATVEFALERPKLDVAATDGEKWIVFGNCLVMTGISPRQLDRELADDRGRSIVNIAAHEQSPIAFFNYLRRNDQYPDVIIANVSSWINGTNFDQESELVMKVDPLGVVPQPREDRPGAQQAYRQGGELGAGKLQREIDDAIATALGHHVQAIGHRYHLADYLIFLGALATTADLEGALYQLNIQSWFRVTSSETDGLGFLGVHVDYRSDWPTAVDQMADRYLKRMRFSRLLTERYWTLLDEAVRAFSARGTRVLFVRMPEHPHIRAFNDEVYALPQRLRELEQRTGAAVIDLSTLGPSEGVRLFDAVHPDAEAAAVITARIAAWLRAHRT